MSGTAAGGRKVASKLLAADPQYFNKLGKLGGQAGTGHAFAHGKVSPHEAGKLGGRPKGSVGAAKRPAETFFIADAQIDSRTIEQFNQQPWYRGWFKRSK